MADAVVCGDRFIDLLPPQDRSFLRRIRRYCSRPSCSACCRSRSASATGPVPITQHTKQTESCHSRIDVPPAVNATLYLRRRQRGSLSSDALRRPFLDSSSRLATPPRAAGTLAESQQFCRQSNPLLRLVRPRTSRRSAAPDTAVVRSHSDRQIHGVRVTIRRMTGGIFACR